MLENLKDQIHSLRWLKPEVAPAVTNQTMKTGRLLQLPIPEGGRGWSVSPPAHHMHFLNAQQSPALPWSLYCQRLLVVIYLKNACVNEEMGTTDSKTAIKQHVWNIYFHYST